MLMRSEVRGTIVTGKINLILIDECSITYNPMDIGLESIGFTKATEHPYPDQNPVWTNQAVSRVSFVLEGNIECDDELRLGFCESIEECLYNEWCPILLVYSDPHTTELLDACFIIHRNEGEFYISRIEESMREAVYRFPKETFLDNDMSRDDVRMLLEFM